MQLLESISDRIIMNAQDYHPTTSPQRIHSEASPRRSESWQAAWVRRTIPLVMALHFGSSQRSAPDVRTLRLRAHRYTWPARFAARLLYSQVRQHPDFHLKGEWIRPETAAAAHTGTVVLFLHGGAYYSARLRRIEPSPTSWRVRLIRPCSRWTTVSRPNILFLLRCRTPCMCIGHCLRGGFRRARSCLPAIQPVEGLRWLRW